MKLILTKPIQITAQAAPITELVFRDAICAGDLRGIKLKALSDPSGSDYLTIAARLTGKTDLELNGLCVTDFVRVCEAVASFLETGPSTIDTLQ